MNVQHRDTPRLGFDLKAPVPRTCWPTATQCLLLQACLGGPELARDAFKAWHSQVDIFQLDHGSNRLMALLYRNLERAGVRAPEHEVLKGNWRYHWYLNKKRMREFGEVQARFATAGIPLIAMKGIPLAAFYYEDLGVRPMADLDVLVPENQTRAAVDFLHSDGYRSIYGYINERTFRDCGVGFAKPGATQVDLHWSVLKECRASWSDEAFWAGSHTRVFEGVHLRFMRAEDQIIHLCAHGMRYSKMPPLRWLADVTMVVQKENTRLDMDYLLREASRREVLNPVKHTFAWLARHLDFPSDHVVRQVLPRMKPSWGERFEYPYRVHPIDGLPALVPAWIDYRRQLSAARGQPGGVVPTESFLTFYARRKNIRGGFTAGVNAAVMFTKRVIPWMAQRTMAWVGERFGNIARPSSKLAARSSVTV